MNMANEQFLWEHEKSRRQSIFPRPKDFNRSCYEVFESFDEFEMNGKPYNLNGCGGIPLLHLDNGEKEVELIDELPSRRPAPEPPKQEPVYMMSPQTEAALWAQATGSKFIPWQGAAGEAAMNIKRKGNMPFIWEVR